MRWTAKLFASFRQLTWRFWATFAVACAVAEGAEYYFEHAINSSSESESYVQSLITLSGVYQKLVAAPRAPILRHVSLVVIDPVHDLKTVSNANVCGEREFLASLLERIDAANPALIVIDKYFGRYSCPENDPGTRDLLRSVETIRAHRPLLVGLRTREIEAAQESHPDQTAGRPSSYLEESLEFPAVGSPGQEGILNIVKDNRRLPLQWRVFTGPDPATDDTTDLDTLALATARAYDPYLLRNNPRLQRVISAGQQPFIGFLEPSQFDVALLYASEALCGHKLSRDANWRECPAQPHAGLLNRIVLVAENSESDQHYSVAGNVQGYYLQGNYIEALLDDRYYSPGGPWFDYSFGFLFLLGLELILVLHHEQLGKALIFVAFLMAAAYFVLYLLIIHAGIYLDPIPVSGTAVVIKLANMTYNLVRRGQVTPGGNP